jgi:hypothetical protein
MVTKPIPTVLLLLAIAYYSWSTYLGGQSRFSKTIRNKTYGAVSVSVLILKSLGEYDEVPGFESAITSRIFTANLGEHFAATASIPASPYKKYQITGYVVFHNGTNTSFEITCFQNNIIEINERYYQVSRNFSNMARVVCEEVQKMKVVQ